MWNLLGLIQSATCYVTIIGQGEDRITIHFYGPKGEVGRLNGIKGLWRFRCR